MNNPYPDGFFSWPKDRQDAYYAEEARNYDRRRANGEDRQEKPKGAPILPVITADTFAGAPAPPRPWHVHGWFPSRQVSLINGDGGIGKTILALQLAVATAGGKPWLGALVPECGAVIYLSAEDDSDELNRRLASIAESYGVDLADLHDLHLIPLAGLDAVLAAPGKPGVIVATPLWKALEAHAAKVKPRLLVVDTLADAFAGDEIKRAEARQFIGLLRGLAIRSDCAVVLLAHPSLSGLTSGTGTSGSTGWNNSVRSRCYFEGDKADDGGKADKNVRTLSMKKSNYGPADAELRLRWSAGCFVPEGSGDPTAGFTAAGAKAERVFLALLDLRNEQGRAVSESRSPTYAPKVFAEHPDSEGVGMRGFAVAMERLLKAGRIRSETFGPPSKPRSRLVTVFGAPETEIPF